MKKIISFLILLLCAFNFSYGQQHNDKEKVKRHMAMGPVKLLDIATIEKVTGMKGQEHNGQYKITILQNDLKVVVDGFKIIPPMGLGSWVAFTPSPDGAMVMGDIVLTETDLAPFEQEVIRQGLTISAIHNHFLRNRPIVMFMHIGGMGNTEVMAKKVKAMN
jgi:hypothetical protein